MKKVVSKVFLAVAFLSFGFAQAQNGNGNGNVNSNNGFTVTNSNSIVPFSTFQYNSCADEEVELVGSLHISTQIKSYADGSIQVKETTNLQGVGGTAVSGNAYNFSDNGVFTFNFNATEITGTIIIQRSANLVGGSAGNTKVHYKIVIDLITGIPTVVFDNGAITCN